MVPSGTGQIVHEERGSSSSATDQRISFTNWQKGNRLGSGSYCTVHEGFTEDGFVFAVKDMLMPIKIETVVRVEQDILSQRRQENLVRYLGTQVSDGKFYIFLELVSGGSLAQLYEMHELQTSQVSEYTRQILNGLNYLHERKVVHGNLKCANILIDVNGYLKLADFGLVKETLMNDMRGFIGSPYWMAPELIMTNEKGWNEVAADIWSLGCTVLEMLTRKIPYFHLELFQAMYNIGYGRLPEIPNTLSEEAQSFIIECLQVNPDDRPTAAELLEHPFVKGSTLMNPGIASPNHRDNVSTET